MSKLDRFLISEGLLSVYPSLSALCLDRCLSDHRPIVMREYVVDFGPTPFRVFQSWFTKNGFVKLVEDTWKNSSFVESNKITLLRKKFHALKSRISDLDKMLDKAVWECGTNKTPGRDGFSFEFIRKFWKIINQDVVNVVHEFFASSKFPPGSNSSFITLISKKQDAKVVKDFRPISLIGTFYKIVAKILANRLSLIMSDIISDVQSAFVSKRQILDGPFILNELLSWCKYHKTEAMIFKADFEKAFDSVRWDYLDGDPLSLFLFILVMESFHISFNNILNTRLFKGICIDDSLTLSHLFYADDAIFIGKWDKANVITIVNMLKCFFLASGLKINILKSKIMGIGTTQEEVNTAAKIIGCTTFSTPFNYLGVKVGSSSTCSRFWDEALAKISSRLSKWKVKTLSIGGRFTLIKSVLSSLPLFQMSVYKTPKGVLHKMESIRWKFFNGADTNENKMSMIGWQKIIASRKKGGLGVSSFFAQNRALLFKWIWRFRSQDSSLCKGIHLLSYMKKKVVADKLNDPTIIQSFRRPPRGGLEEEQYGNLLDIVQSVILSDSKDRWVWSLDSTGEFSVKSARLYIDDYLLPSVGAPTRWVKEVPIKINILAWKVSLDKLPNRLNLSLRGIEISSISCPICCTAGFGESIGTGNTSSGRLLVISSFDCVFDLGVVVSRANGKGCGSREKRSCVVRREAKFRF
ncbi:RNA-directed DNA polymerase, eukaryota [Tanacetum coccineum]